MIAFMSTLAKMIPYMMYMLTYIRSTHKWICNRTACFIYAITLMLLTGHPYGGGVLQAEVVNGSLVSVSWSAIIVEENTAQLQGYRVVAVQTAETSGDDVVFDVGFVTSTVLKRGLLPAKTYRMYVVAYNEGGESTRDASATVQIPPTKCRDDEYEAEPPVDEKDRVCKACTVCDYNEFLSEECTKTSDAVCRECRTCGFNQWKATECTRDSDTDCEACRGCPPGTHVVRLCSVDSDTLCSGDEYVYYMQCMSNNEIAMICQMLGHYNVLLSSYWF